MVQMAKGARNEIDWFQLMCSNPVPAINPRSSAVVQPLDLNYRAKGFGKSGSNALGGLVRITLCSG
jgi:hypothetical protein